MSVLSQSRQTPVTSLPGFAREMGTFGMRSRRILMRSHRMHCLASLVVLVLLAGHSAAFRLYPEQAGKYNWYAAHVGTYDGVALCDDNGSSSSMSLPSFVVATDDGVVARLRAEDGGLVWRQVLEEGVKVDGKSVACANGVVVVDQGAHVFDAEDGHWRGDAMVDGLKELTNVTPERVCIVGSAAASASSNSYCINVVVARGAKGISEAEMGGYAGGSSRPVSTAVAFGDVAVVQYACGTSRGFDRKTQKVVWERHEYLASIDHVLFTDLPPSTPALEDEWRRTQPSTSHALFVQLLILKTQFGLGTPRDHATIDSYKAMTSNLLRPTRDMDGFRQQIVVSSTHSGKVAALHSGDGRVLWEADVGPTGGLATLVTVPWSVSETEMLLAVFGRFASGNGVRVMLLDGFTGRVVKDDVLSGEQLNIVPVGSYERGKTTQHAFAVVQDAGTGASSNDNKVVSMLPEEAAREEAVKRSMETAVRWEVAADKRSVYGVKMGVGEVWRLDVSGSSTSETTSKRVLEVVGRDMEEAMYSVAKPVFGGGVLIKSVNPNALLVIAGDGDSIQVIVIDAITGRVIVSQDIRHARGPVKGVVSENWVAVHYWDSRNARWTMGVIDLYHPQPADLTVASLITGTYGKNETASPYEPPKELIVESERFRVKYAASCLAVTKTAHGTAAKMLLLGTPEGQIAAIDRRMLDPRRPKVAPGAKPTPEQVFERLPPFHPEVGVGGASFVTLFHRVERLRGVTTSSAVLESSSLVFAHGIDTYFMRMMPSRGFDTVPPDFPRALLVTMVLGLALALGLLRRIVRHRTVNLTWR